MNDVTVVTSVTYPSPESLALVADVQYHEPYLSAALNRKFRGIVDPGFYAGFLPKPGGGMNLLITSVDGDKTAGAASVDIGEFYQVTIQHRKDISLALNAGKKYAIVLKGRYLLGEDTYQVNTASHIYAAEFIARTYTDSYQLGNGELLVCTVNIPAGVSAITQEMIDTSERINRTIGIDISDSVTSTRSDVAASSLAVKKAYDLAAGKAPSSHTHPWNQITGVPTASLTAKGITQLSSATNSTSEVLAATPKAVKAAYDLANGKYTAQDATTTQKGIVQLSSATNSTSETLAATPKAVRDGIKNHEEKENPHDQYLQKSFITDIGEKLISASNPEEIWSVIGAESEFDGDVDSWCIRFKNGFIIQGGKLPDYGKSPQDFVFRVPFTTAVLWHNALGYQPHYTSNGGIAYYLMYVMDGISLTGAKIGMLGFLDPSSTQVKPFPTSMMSGKYIFMGY